MYLDKATRMEIITFIYFIITMVLTSSVKGSFIELKAKLNSAVNFYLPSFEECGSYNFSHTSLNIMLLKTRNSDTITSLYKNRTIHTRQSNGSEILTLHHITESDFGKYLIRPGPRAAVSCWKQFSLTHTSDGITTTQSGSAYWLLWQPWSSCLTTCGPGYRSRTRTCSIQNMCSGNSSENSVCQSSRTCDVYSWSSWSEWSECSVTCNTGQRSRYRSCMKNYIHKDLSIPAHCPGDVVEYGPCSETCDQDKTMIQDVRPVYYWSTWSTWSSCSQSCGTGVMSRARQCQYEQRIIDVKYCQGKADENVTCSSTSCEEGVTTNDKIVAVPLSVIVGSAAGLLFLILFIVIVVLVCKLRRKRIRTIPVLVSPQDTGNNEAIRRPKHSIVSFASNEPSGAYVYDTIDDDDVISTRDRQSVLTIDNPYVALPKSPGGTTYANEAAMYNNTQGTCYVFDNGSRNERKISNAYLNTGSNGDTRNTSSIETSGQLDVPRHMSVDSLGYMMPGTKAERALKRNKRFRRSKDK